MSQIKVDTITDEAGTGAPNFPNGLTGDGSGLTNLSASGVGVNQTWQTVTRSMATSYQNTTGKPIAVAARFASSTVNILFQISTDNSTWITVSESISIPTGRTTFAIVPNNHYYRTDSASGTIGYWVELR